jgi:hypothetical protein
MHDVIRRRRISIQQRTEEVEGSGHVDVGNVDMPMLVRLQRLHETGPFLRRREVPPIEPARLFQHTANSGRTDGHHIVVRRFHASNVATLAVLGLLGPGNWIKLPAASYAGSAQPPPTMPVISFDLPAVRDCWRSHEAPAVLCQNCCQFPAASRPQAWAKFSVPLTMELLVALSWPRCIAARRCRPSFE